MRGLKSSSKIKGRWAEDRVIKHLQKLGYKIRARNKRIYGVEHDIVALSKDQSFWLLIEVKCLARPEDMEWRLRPKQRHRLLRSARQFAESQEGRGVELWVYGVSPGGELQSYPLEA